MISSLENIFERYGVRADYFLSVTSTNDISRDKKYGDGDIIVAGTQTAGRGQRGNSWESAADRNLTFSYVFCPASFPPADQFRISKAVSLAVIDLIGLKGVEARIKWPNDIYVGGSKICGMLIENDIMGANIKKSIIGIGLNINQTEFSSCLPNPVSLKLLTGKDHDIGETLQELYGRLRSRLAEIADRGLEREYHDRLYLLNRPHRFTLADGTPLDGSIKSVDPTGELVIRTSDGDMRRFLFKEIIF